MTPKLTVLLTSYNYGHFLPKALDAILAQLEDNELVIVDDGSTDGSKELLQAIAANDSRMRLVVHPENRGVHAALARGLEIARGRYLLCEAADDELLPGMLRKGIDMLDRHPQAGFFTSPVSFIDSKGRHVDSWRGPALDDGYNSPSQAQAHMLRRGFWFCGAATMFRLEALREAGGFPRELGNLADSFITQVVALRHGFCSTSSPLARVRADAHSYSSMERRNLTAAHQSRLEAVRRMQSMPDLFPAVFVREWQAVWGFLDTLKAWRGSVIEGPRRILVKDIYLFREKPTLLDRFFIVLLKLGMTGQLALFALWGCATLCRHTLFRQYLDPRRLACWIRKQLT